MKNILLIAYTFPPAEGIGGRRWAKFAKYLVRHGYAVHVITAENDSENKISLWQDDVKNENIKIYSLRSGYPSVLNSEPASIAHKINYRLALRYCLLKSDGSPYDRAIFWKKRLLQKCRELISEYNITNVISTGAPFRNLYYSTLLKKDFPELNIITDFRDPWTEGKSYGFQMLSDDRRRQEILLEKETCSHSDFILAPNKYILNYLQNKYNLPEEKLKVVPHAYDEDDLPVDYTNTRKEDDKFRFIFFGTFYEGAESYLKVFVNTLEKLIESNAGLQDKVSADFFSWSLSLQKYKFPSALKTVCTVHTPLAPRQLFEKVAKSDFIVAFYTDKYKDYISTKFIELLPLKKQILYFGPAGAISEFLSAKKTGFHVTESDAVGIISSSRNSETAGHRGDEWKEFSYNTQTGLLTALFK